MGSARWVGEWLRHCRSVRYTTPGSQKQFIFRAAEWERDRRDRYMLTWPEPILVVLISEAFVFGILRRRHSVRAAVDPRLPRRSFLKTYTASRAYRYIFSPGNNSLGNRYTTRRELTRAGNLTGCPRSAWMVLQRSIIIKETISLIFERNIECRGCRRTYVVRLSRQSGLSLWPRNVITGSIW